MRKTITICIFISAIILTNIIVHAQDAQVAASGAELSLYHLTGAVRPSTDIKPLITIVDKANSFSKNNLRRNKETKSFQRQNVFMVWNGYISVPQTGNYTFSMFYSSLRPAYHKLRNTIFQISNKDLIVISDKQTSQNRSLALEKGDYKITIIHKGLPRADFSLEMFDNVNPQNKTKINPATMVHIE